MNWVTGGSMWLQLTTEAGHESAIRYGGVLGCRADRIALPVNAICGRQRSFKWVLKTAGNERRLGGGREIMSLGFLIIS
jgi:hypothetical protein